MDSRLSLALAAAAALAVIAAGSAGFVRAQQPDQPNTAGTPKDAGPPPPLPPSLVSPAEQKPSDQTKPAEQAPSAQPGPTAINPPAPVSMKPIAEPSAPAKPAQQQPLAAAPPPPTPPPAPPPPRGPVAVLQVLDKVTAETLKFIAPVGRAVRYKTLVFTVRACETRASDAPQPRPSAYVLIESRAGAVRGAGPPAKEIYKGWMFANAPDVHPFEHPVYDAWLVACGAAATPPA